MHNKSMPVFAKTQQRKSRPMSRALVSLAEGGFRADLEAQANLKVAYKRFVDQRESGAKNEAGKDLIRAIFGTDAIAKDTLR